MPRQKIKNGGFYGSPENRAHTIGSDWSGSYDQRSRLDDGSSKHRRYWRDGSKPADWNIQRTGSDASRGVGKTGSGKNPYPRRHDFAGGNYPSGFNGRRGTEGHAGKTYPALADHRSRRNAVRNDLDAKPPPQ